MLDIKNKTSTFADRHIGPRSEDIQRMLTTLGYASMQDFIEDVVPADIRSASTFNLNGNMNGLSESEVLAVLKNIASQNQVFRSLIGMGYHNCFVPPVIQRNILENPGWYTQYTPYQAEISQGRLEALLNFQTMVIDLTGLPIANASLLDEATAAAEAMTMCLGKSTQKEWHNFFVSETCHPQTIAVLQTRAEPLGIKLQIGDHRDVNFDTPILGAIVQYPATDGAIYDYHQFAEQVYAAGGLFVTATDLLSLTLLKPPGEFGADIVIGNSQRFGVPLGYGGPHAAFLSTREELKRNIPGRIAGVSHDVNGETAIRLALQTREQHIRREKATSNICTAQVLLAVMAGMYAVYHGPTGLKRIAERVHAHTCTLRTGLEALGYTTGELPCFDTISITVPSQENTEKLIAAARAKQINLRAIDATHIGISLDETVTSDDVEEIQQIFAENNSGHPKQTSNHPPVQSAPIIPVELQRESPYLTHPVFNSYHSETEMLRYIHRLQTKDLSLVNAMIPLGSCTMKLNATTEMIPVTWREFGELHPFVPQEQAEGYRHLFLQLETWLAEITGYSGISLQPNAGSQGEYAGLLVIRKYHQSRGAAHRDVCLIPTSAHGTNPASAVMAGMKVVVVACDSDGNIDLDDLRTKADTHRDTLAAAMITYPSTHGVFEEKIREICDIVHQAGGQVYMDGANLNALVGIAQPADIGADVCHLNLHKTFCIPHGGGGPGMGPIGVKAHLTDFLPTHPVIPVGGKDGIGAVSAAPWGSPGILPISWVYIAMMGADGLTSATEVAILNANYIAKKLAPHYPVLYTGKQGLVAHECIIDLRAFKKSADIDVTDVAKRLMDYGFHAPTVSWPVPGTMMIEPTESESKAELDRFCDALIAIREEITEIEDGTADQEDNVLKNAPHTVEMVTQSDWRHPYPREKAAFPKPWVRDAKFWPAVARINEVYGDRNLMCACPPLDEY